MVDCTQRVSSADILIEDQLCPPLDMVIVDEERKLPNQTAELSANRSSWYKSPTEVCLNNANHVHYFGGSLY